MAKDNWGMQMPNLMIGDRVRVQHSLLYPGYDQRPRTGRIVGINDGSSHPFVVEWDDKSPTSSCNRVLEFMKLPDPV